MWMKFLFLFVFINLISSELIGDHICPEEERYVVNVTRYIIRNITVRNYQWCLQVPPRCSVYEIKAVNHSKVEEEERVQLINKCCEGYQEDSFHKKCIPLTCFNCTHGKCIEDEWCDCEFGYKGLTCEETCDSNHWGKSCRNRCQCERGVCHPQTGECVCPPRWNGSRCEICAEGHVGEQCNCTCNKTTACDLITSKCTSASDYESQTYEAIDNYENETENLSATENVDFYPPENYRSAYQDPVLQKYHTFDLATPNEYTTRIPRTYLPMKHTTRKKSTSLPYSYFTSTATPKGPLLDSNSPLAKFFFDTENNLAQNSDKPKSNLGSKTEVVTAGNTQLEELTQRALNNSNTFLNAEGDSPEISIRDYDKNKQELTLVNTEMERPANLTQHERKAKAFQMNVSNTNAGHVREERFLNDERPPLTDVPQEPLPMNGLVYSIVSAVLVTVTILLLTGVSLACLKLRKRVVKFETSKTDGDTSNTLPAVSVTANSIFHTPLPDPPLFENPVFSTPVDINRTGPTFEARVVCSMNFPKQTNCMHDTPDMFYDHPPSTGSYRAASLPEPPDTFDPIYDEIPCYKKLAAITSTPTFHTANDICLYMNTNKT